MKAKDAVRYLDDVMAVGSNRLKVLRAFYDQFKATAEQIGWRLDKSGKTTKGQSPETTVVALGVHFDTETWNWRMDALVSYTRSTTP